MFASPTIAGVTLHIYGVYRERMLEAQKKHLPAFTCMARNRDLLGGPSANVGVGADYPVGGEIALAISGCYPFRRLKLLKATAATMIVPTRISRT